MRLELKPHFDPRRSFYGKAFVEFNEHNNLNKCYILLSYGVQVMKISKYYIRFNKECHRYSATTLRHIRELLRQYADLDYDIYRFGRKVLKDKHKLYNITKKDIYKNNFIFVNTLTSRQDTRQKAIKKYNS